MKTSKPSISLTPFHALADLFQGPLAAAAFPGVDAATIVSLVAEAERRASSVASARVALASAEDDLAAADRAFGEHLEHLIEKAQLAVAYARVFAGSDLALAAALEQIALPRARPARATSVPAPAGQAPGITPPRRRGRPPKVAAAPAAVPSEIAAE